MGSISNVSGDGKEKTGPDASMK